MSTSQSVLVIEAVSSDGFQKRCAGQKLEHSGIVCIIDSNANQAIGR
jgi:hypothetical protein